MWIIEVVLMVIGSPDETVHIIGPLATERDCTNLVEEIRPWFFSSDRDVGYTFILREMISPLEASRRFDC